MYYSNVLHVQCNGLHSVERWIPKWIATLTSKRLKHDGLGSGRLVNHIAPVVVVGDWCQVIDPVKKSGSCSVMLLCCCETMQVTIMQMSEGNPLTLEKLYQLTCPCVTCPMLCKLICVRIVILLKMALL